MPPEFSENNRRPAIGNGLTDILYNLLIPYSTFSDQAVCLMYIQFLTSYIGNPCKPGNYTEAYK